MGFIVKFLKLQNTALGKKLLFYILFFSTLVTLFLTSVQIYLDYRLGVQNIYSTLEQIKKTQVRSLGQNLWNLNEPQINTQLRGLLEINSISKLAIYPENEDPIILQKKEHSVDPIISIFPISYIHDGKNVHLGHLEITSDKSHVVNEIKSRILIILFAQGTKTFLVSLFILAIFNSLVSRQIIKISRYASKIGLENLTETLKINRTKNERPDEIDDLVKSLNLMRERILKEVSQRKDYENQLRQSQKMEALGTLSSGIAHDFNNILQGLYNALFLLEEEVIDNADALQTLNYASNLADRARELVRQILIFTRQEEGRFSTFRPTKPIQDVVDILRAGSSGHVNVEFIVDANKSKILGDPTQIKQIILNLGNNAIHALEGNFEAKLKIKLSKDILTNKNQFQLPEGHYFKIEVEDNGQGMSKNTQLRVFEPFFTTKEVGKGTGLGLSVVHGIVQGHKGAIDLVSIQNEGTKFTVYLPIIKENNPAQIVQYTQNENIYIISNDTTLNTYYRDYLIAIGHKVIIFENESIALEQIKYLLDNRQMGKSIILINEQLAEFSAEELIRKIRQRLDKVPIVLLRNSQKLGAIIPIGLKVVEQIVGHQGIAKLDRNYIENSTSGSIKTTFDQACERINTF